MERLNATVIGHYELTDHVRAFSELTASSIKANSPDFSFIANEFLGVYAAPFPRLRPIAFTSGNPYLSQATIAQLSALSPEFAAGQPLYLAKTFANQGSKYSDQRYRTKTYRGLIGLDGDFEALDRKFFWEVSYSYAKVDQTIDGYHLAFPNVLNAANAVRNGSGQIVCAINNPVVTDPSCQPLNIFGTDPIPQSTLDYIYRPSGNIIESVLGNVNNTYQDILGTISGDLVRLPGGQAKFSTTYEHRRASARFTPSPGDQAGIFFNGRPTLAASGRYSINEIAAELSIPIVGDRFTLPLVESLELNGSYRLVDNSLVGKDSVWSGGLRWRIGGGLQLRATRSRNFRAPSIGQITAPSSVGVAVTQNPCSSTLIANGPAPATRAANCLALFTANPSFGADRLPLGVANTPANRLANFFGTAVAVTSVNTSGNPGLKNEIADTLTAGFVFQPEFIPGLTVSADILRIKLKDGLALFNTSNFAANCFDSAPQPAEYCGVLGYDTSGQITTGRATTVNVARSSFRAEIYNIDYRLPLSRIDDDLPGSLNLVLQAVHNTLQTTTFAGTTTRTDGTIDLPSWVIRLDARYRVGPFGLSYSLNYLPSAKLNHTATVENSPNGVFKVSANVRHDISAEYAIGENYTVRVGVNNVTNRYPSYPTFTYGDIVGRSVFAVASMKL